MSLQVSISGKRLELRERFLRSRGVRPCSHRALCRPGTRGESGNGVGWGVFAHVCALRVHFCVCVHVLHVCSACVCMHCMCVRILCVHCVCICVCARPVWACVCTQFTPVHCTHPCLVCRGGYAHACRAHSPVTPSDRVPLSPGPRCEEEEEEAEGCHPSRPCLHGGSCVHGSCHCPPGHSGARCQHREETAQGHGGTPWGQLETQGACKDTASTVRGKHMEGQGGDTWGHLKTWRDISGH